MLNEIFFNQNPYTMFRFIITKTIIAYLFFSLLGHSAKAQINKGFELLQKREPAAAQKAFEKDYKSKKKKAAADLGMLQAGILQTELNSWVTIREATNRVKMQEAAIMKLSSKKRDKLRKAGYNELFVKKLKTDLQKQSLILLRQEGTVVGVDTFKAIWKSLDAKVNKEFRSLREQIVLERINSNDYLDLRSIVKNHKDVFRKKLLQMPNFDRLLITSFLVNYPLHDFRKFTLDFPKHNYLYDCYVREFLVAAEKKSLSELLQFIEKYPLSVLDELISWGMIVNDNNNYLTKQFETLSAEEKRHYLDINASDKLLASLFYKQYDNKVFLDTLKTILKHTAPHRKGYGMLQQGLGYLMKKKAWEECLALVEFATPLFPDKEPPCGRSYDWHVNKQKWFKTVITLLRRPSENVALYSLKDINSIADEFSPVISADGNTLYFAAKGREGSDGYSEDVYSSYWNGSNWEEPILIEELSGDERNEAPLSITTDGNEMLLFIDGDLCLSQLTSRGWGKVVPLPDAINKLPWVGKASLASDGRTLIFEASKSEDITSDDINVDLYISFRISGNNWSNPVQMSSSINTGRNERSPFLHPDLRTLYFSSNGHAGFDEMDVYKITRLDDTWQKWGEPVNLGKEINSMEDDWGYNFSITSNSKIAYLSSGGVVGLTSGDLVATGLPEYSRAKPIQIVNGKIKIEGDSSQHFVKAVDPSTGKVIATVPVRPDGTYTLPVRDSVVSVLVSMVDKDVISNGQEVIVPPHQDVIKAPQEVIGIKVAKMIKEDKPLPLRALIFDVAKTELNDAAKMELDQIVERVKDITAIIEITGHTDDEGNELFNQTLSLERANTVATYLKEKGLPTKRIRIEGAGESKPVVDNSNEENKRLNRRVEIKLKKE